MKTLLLLFHPDFSKSHANRALIESISPLGIDVVDMQARYPDSQIDLDHEVAQLLATDRLIFQFPIQWYSTPPLLKTWQDTVLTRMFYINAKTEGDKLKGLPFLVAATAGNTPSAYTPTGINLFGLNELLKPLHSTAHRCGFKWSEPFLIYESNKSSAAVLKSEGERYARFVTEWQSAQSFES